MGLFSRNRVAAAMWLRDESGVMSNGDCGGDVQDGDSYSVRFMSPGLPGRFITVTYYAVQYDEWGSDEWGVERQVEWSVRDDDGEALWEDSQTDLVNESSIAIQQAAEEEAAAFAAEDDSDLGAELYGTWDGEPFPVGDPG